MFAIESVRRMTLDDVEVSSLCARISHELGMRQGIPLPYGQRLCKDLNDTELSTLA